LESDPAPLDFDPTRSQREGVKLPHHPGLASQQGTAKAAQRDINLNTSVAPWASDTFRQIAKARGLEIVAQFTNGGLGTLRVEGDPREIEAAVRELGVRCPGALQRW
jgi:hypothetical protein